MRPLARLLRSRKGAFVEPPFWSQPSILPASLLGEKERIENSFEGFVQGAYKRNGVVFACILARMLVFSEARFLWRRLRQGRPADLFGDASLRLLERPWRNGTTGELLARMEQDTSLAGNFYATVVGEGARARIRRLRPDWVTIVTGSPDDDPFALEAEPVAYIYEPRGGIAGAVRRDPVLLPAERVLHWSPIPDPEAQWRGMSWLQTVVDEIKADAAATKHKLRFFEQGATLGVAITYDPSVSQESFDAFVKHFRENHDGLQGAYKTLHLGGGADVKTVGTNLQQLEFKATQGAGETRIAAASGVGAVIVGLSEGMQGSSLNAGNYAAARRRFADGTIRPLWRSAAAAFETLVPPPAGDVQLWYDDRDVPFLREDAADAAAIRKEDALTVESFVRAGFKPDTAVRAVQTGDMSVLEHTGLFSVQLQPPGMTAPADTDA